MVITNLLKKSFKIAEKRGWDRIYIGIDIHDTILVPDYEGVSSEYYPYAKACLQLMSKRKDIDMFIWTCSHPKDQELYQKLFKGDDINFLHVNENPAVLNTNYGDFSKKPYANIVIDDKCGFEPIEWKEMYKYLSTKKEIEL